MNENDRRPDLDALIVRLRTERTYWTGQPARSLKDLLAEAADALAEVATAEMVPRQRYNEQVRLVARMDESEKAAASAVAAERERADALSLIIEQVRALPTGHFGTGNYGYDGDALDAIVEAAPAALLAAHDAEVKAQTYEEAARSVPGGIGRQAPWLIARAAKIREQAK